MSESLIVVATETAVSLSERLIRARIRRLLAELNANRIEKSAIEVRRQAILSELEELGWKFRDKTRNP